MRYRWFTLRNSMTKKAFHVIEFVSYRAIHRLLMYDEKII